MPLRGPRRTDEEDRTRECGRTATTVPEEHEMNDSDRHDQIEALAELKRLLDNEEGADADDIRDGAIRAVNRFDHSIAVHDDWHAYSRRGSSDADDIRDGAIRAVNRFDHSIAVHDDWHAYSRRGSSDPGTLLVPERAPRPRNWEAPGSSSTPSTEAACGAASDPPSRTSRSTNTAAKTATRPLATTLTTSCDTARPSGKSISSHANGLGIEPPRAPLLGRRTRAKRRRSRTPRWPALENSLRSSHHAPHAGNAG